MTTATDGPVRQDDVGDESALMSWMEGDPQLMAICTAAVDPLEIAARLETYGMSTRVATDTFGFPDVFAAARAVYRQLPFRQGESPTPARQPMGGPIDLLRGALYAVPALLFTVAVTGFSIVPRWWVLPVGLTTAWATSQLVAVVAWTLRGRQDDRSDALLALGSIVVTVVVALGFALAVRRLLGGGMSNVVVAVALAAYIAASGVLLFHRAEWLLALCMLPAAVGSLLALGFAGPTLSHRQASWTVVATGALVAVVANRYVFRRRWHWPSLLSADRRRAGLFLVYGLGCGLLTSVFIGFASEANGTGGALVIAVWPLLLTLGLMEWHLRSFQSRAAGAMRRSSELRQFGRRVRLALLRSVGTYVAVLALFSVAGVEIADARHAVMVPLLLAAVGTLGVLFFLALLVESAGHIKMVLAIWGATFAVLGTILAVNRPAHGHITAATGITALLCATGMAVVVLAVLACRVLTSPLIY